MVRGAKHTVACALQRVSRQTQSTASTACPERRGRCRGSDKTTFLFPLTPLFLHDILFCRGIKDPRPGLVPMTNRLLSCQIKQAVLCWHRSRGAAAASVPDSSVFLINNKHLKITVGLVRVPQNTDHHLPGLPVWQRSRYCTDTHSEMFCAGALQVEEASQRVFNSVLKT